MINLTGQRFGRLVALKPLLRRHSSTGAVLWKCICDCGKYATVPSASLRSLHSKSCGCWHRDAAAKQINENRPKISATLKHGGTSSLSDPALLRAYRIYRAVICRCYNPHARSYRFYGAVGVQVCPRWRGPQGFDNFVADCGLPKPGESIGRWMDSGFYEPANAWFVSHADQQQQRRNKQKFLRNTLVTAIKRLRQEKES